MKDSLSDNDLKSKLFVVNEEGYGEDYKKHLLEQYKLCLEMADKNSSRRSTANNFFLSVNTVLLTATGILSRVGPSSVTFNLLWVVMTSFAGILFCWTWLVTIKCYRDLSEAKFRVINAIERRLPAAAFEVEWTCLNPENRTAKYLQLTRVERYVPIVLAVLYLVLMLIGIVSAAYLFLAKN